MKRRTKQPTRAAVRGDRVKALREAMNWTQTDLASKLGCTAAEVSRIENSRRDMYASTLVQLADAFPSVSLDFLTGRSDVADRHPVASGSRVRK
jgi:transcriptional regulator with XRE-family HTH domain